jgi:hypothetical protein
MAPRRPRITLPPDWLKPGALVDYRSVIGEPATHLAREVLAEPWQLGHGAWVVKIEGVSGGVAVEAVTPCVAVVTETSARVVEIGEDGDGKPSVTLGFEDGEVLLRVPSRAACRALASVLGMEATITISIPLTGKKERRRA